MSFQKAFSYLKCHRTSTILPSWLLFLKRKKQIDVRQSVKKLRQSQFVKINLARVPNKNAKINGKKEWKNQRKIE